ncbi:STAS domain-containing protein [Streptomyces sp. C]|uniref:STAS domain-containing protein n=1 Tax=Streptomyces sp. C TaxID=253839 RepID=UPI0001B56D95|nr:STAS domain-containing protein [Streptomyces sp. C]EFL19238.1 predicted protein [Streptomyces sp. C]
MYSFAASGLQTPAPSAIGEADIAITVTTTKCGTTVTVSGEIDFASSAALRKALMAAVAAHDGGPGAITLDLSRVTFCDCSGLNVLLTVRDVARREHHLLVIGAAGRPVRRLLEVTGTAGLFAGSP